MAQGIRAAVSLSLRIWVLGALGVVVPGAGVLPGAGCTTRPSLGKTGSGGKVVVKRSSSGSLLVAMIKVGIIPQRCQW